MKTHNASFILTFKALYQSESRKSEVVLCNVTCLAAVTLWEISSPGVSFSDVNNDIKYSHSFQK